MQTQVYDKGIIALPKEARKAIGIKKGTTLTVNIVENSIILSPSMSVIRELHEKYSAKGPYEYDVHKSREEMMRRRLSRAGINVH